MKSSLWAAVEARHTEEIHRAARRVIPVFPTIHTELTVAGWLSGNCNVSGQDRR